MKTPRLVSKRCKAIGRKYHAWTSVTRGGDGQLFQTCTGEHCGAMRVGDEVPRLLRDAFHDRERREANARGRAASVGVVQ